MLRKIGIGEEHRKEPKKKRLSKWNDYRRILAIHADDNEEASEMGTAEELRRMIIGYTQSMMDVRYDDNSEDEDYWN